MGVLRCGRYGCDEIMCDVLIDGRYVCHECLDQFRQKVGGETEMNAADFAQAFDDFMATRKRAGEGDPKRTVNQFIEAAIERSASL